MKNNRIYGYDERIGSGLGHSLEKGKKNKSSKNVIAPKETVRQREYSMSCMRAT